MKRKILEWFLHRFFPGCHVVEPRNMGTLPHTKESAGLVVFVYKCVIHENEEFFLYTTLGHELLKPLDGIDMQFKDGE